MQKQRKKLVRSVLIGALISLVLLVLVLLIVKSICGGNAEQCDKYITRLSMIVMVGYVVSSFVNLARYNNYARNYEHELLERTKRELTTEYKPVLLKCSGSLLPEMFECQAKVNEDGKIVCNIKLEHEFKFESYEGFLLFYQLPNE